MVATPIGIARTYQNGFERCHDRSVKLGLDRLGEPETRNGDRHRVAVGALRGHRVIGIGDGDDP
jgi:hypothetical protein